MTTTENNILNGLNKALSNLISVDQLGDDALSDLLELSFEFGLSKWLQDAYDEAVDRARNGVRIAGFVLTESRRRKISDPDAALAAVQQIDPSLVPLCQDTSLAGIRVLKQRLGRHRFEQIFGPFITTITYQHLSPEGD